MDNFTAIRNPLLDHLVAGKLSLFDFGLLVFLIMRADLNVKRGDVAAVKGKRIGAAPLIDIGLIELLKEYGIDPKRDGVQIAPPPMPANPAGVSFGVNAAKAMEEGKIDGFWANGMGAEVAVRRGIGTVLLDVRRGDGPPRARSFTFAALVTTEQRIQHEPETAAAAVQALVRAQQALRQDPELAQDIGRRLFPAVEAELIAELRAWRRSTSLLALRAYR